MSGKEMRLAQVAKKRIIKRLTVLVVAVFVVAGLFWWLTSYLSGRDKNLPGNFYPQVGREHIPLGSIPPAPYNSNPPSSGAHYEEPANWSVYDYEVNDQIFIHNLEHGGVWFAYKPGVPQKVIQQLKGIYAQFGGSKIVMAPRSANDMDIAVVAWSRVLKFNLSGSELTDAEKQNIVTFYKDFKNKGPELVPDDMPGIDPKSVPGGAR